MKILNRWNNEIIIERDVSTMKELVEIAVKENINLYEADLNGANLNEANLNGANLYGVNLNGANLREANLYGVSLRGANLYEADLNGANLNEADLREAKLSSANLLCLGNMKEIRTMQIDTYRIGFTKNMLQIGCQRHPIEEWKNLSDDEISSMDNGALEWWNKWKEFIFEAIELSFEK